MTTPLRSTPHSQLPTSQSAPVAEFRCLYTPDIRKKQKKWQDGYLKFHSFNNRVMVYDQARNFLGDTYYKDSNELHEGDELTLDKGVMVEVADAMGVTQTDLTPLFDKKPKETHPPSAPPRRFQPPSQVARLQAARSINSNNSNKSSSSNSGNSGHNVRANSQLRHKSLNTLLGTPKGPIGKSVPIKSPYEARQEKGKENENDYAVERAAKRQKNSHSFTSSATLRLSSPPQEAVSAPRKTLPLGAKTSDKTAPRKPAEPIPQGAPRIALDELNLIPDVFSDASLPSTPPLVSEVPARVTVTPAPSANPRGAQKSGLQTPKIPKGKVPVPSVKALETPRVQAPASSPPVSASNRLTNIEFAIQPTPARKPSGNPSKPHVPLQPPQSAPQNPKAKTLRLPAGMKRGTLMVCQSLPPPRAKGANKARTHQETAETPHTDKRTNSERVPPDRHSHVSNGDQEVFHCSIDKRPMVVPVSQVALSCVPSEPILVIDKSEEAIPRLRAERCTVRDVRKTSLSKAQESESARAMIAPVQITKAIEHRKKSVQKAQPDCNPSQTVIPVAGRSESHSRAASPVLSAVSEARSRTASISPQKLAVLSTDGSRRNLKHTTPQSTLPADELFAAPDNKAILLPPHSLHSKKKTAVMTTTELAAMLQKPTKKTKPTVEYIGDRGANTGKSSDQKFERIRRENDAPIPSTSESWEKKNLPNSVSGTTVAAPTEATEAPEAPAAGAKKKSGLAALVKRTDPRRKLAHTQSLNVDASVPPAHITEPPMVSPVVDADVGPWSTEAFDLFDWRPPRSAEVET